MYKLYQVEGPQGGEQKLIPIASGPGDYDGILKELFRLASEGKTVTIIDDSNGLLHAVTIRSYQDNHEFIAGIVVNIVGTIQLHRK